jgi:hypothetical protein
LSSTVEVKGGRELRRALKKYTPDLAKEVNQEMASYLKPVVRQAKSYLPAQAPLSNWGKETASAETINYRPFPRYNGLKARRGVGYTTVPSKPNKKGFSYLAQIFNSEAGGAIYETAGRKNPNGRRPVMSTYLKEYGTTFAMEGNKRGKKSYNSNNPFAGYQFVHSMPDLYKVPRKANQSGRLSRMMNGRVIFRAWAETNGEVTPKIIKAMENAKTKFNTHKKAA